MLQTAQDTYCSIFMAGFKHGTLRKFLSKKGKGQRPMVNFNTNKTPHTLYICSLYLKGVGRFIMLRLAGKCYPPLSIKQQLLFELFKANVYFFLGKFLQWSGKKKKRQIKTEFINPKQLLERHVPLPQLFFFFYKWISSEAIWHFLVWNIISSSICRTPLSPWCIFLTEPSLLGLLYHKSHHIIFDNLY